MRVNKELSKGSHEIIILKLLSRKDMYGYQIIHEMESLSNNVFSMSQGSLYPFLHIMESKGYIKSYEQTEKGRKRRFYSMTDDGNGVLKDKEDQWLLFINAMGQILRGNEYEQA